MKNYKNNKVGKNIKYTKLQKLLMIAGDSNACPDKRREAWRASTIYDSGYAAFTYRLAKSYSKGDTFFCEDLVNEVYVAVRVASKGYRPIGSAHQWRKDITIHAMYDIYRKKKRREKIVKTMGFSSVYDIEDFIGDDPHLNPK